MNTVPVVVSFNKKYTIPALITVLSVIRSSSFPSRLEFFALHNGLDRYIVLLCEKLVASWGGIINFVDCRSDIEGVYNPNTGIHSSETFNTLLIPSIFSRYPRALYLDVDLLVRDDVLVMVDELPEDKKVGGIRCLYRNYTRYGDDYHGFRTYAHDVLKIRNPYDYFNSGVVVFNNRNITTEDRHRCVDLIQKKWEHHDEGILNHVFQDDLHLFPVKWNMDVFFLDKSPLHFTSSVSNDLLQADGEFSIVHFLGRYKPWLESGLSVENRYMKEYGVLWRDVKDGVEKMAAETLCGSMWRLMNRVDWQEA